MKIDLFSFFATKKEEIYVGVILLIIGLFFKSISKFFKFVWHTYKTARKKEKNKNKRKRKQPIIKIVFRKYNFTGSSLSIPIHPTFILTLTNLRSRTRTILWNNIYYTRIASGKTEKYELKVIRAHDKDRIILEKNIPIDIFGEIHPAEFEYLKKIFIIDTDNRKSEIEKKSLKLLKEQARKMLIDLKNAYEKRK